METLTNYDLQALFLGALLPLIAICVLLIIAKLSYQLHKKRDEIRFLNNILSASSELLDKKEAKINKLECDLTETKKKLIDALQQKTRANDYAKECETKMLVYKSQNESQRLEILKLKSVNEDQSKSIKHMIIVYGHACDELKAKEALLVKCETSLKEKLDINYTANTTKVVGDRVFEWKKVGEIDIPDFNEAEKLFIAEFRKQRIKNIVDKLDSISEFINKRNESMTVPNFKIGGITSTDGLDWMTKASNELIAEKLKKEKQDIKPEKPAKVKPYYYTPLAFCNYKGEGFDRSVSIGHVIGGDYCRRQCKYNNGFGKTQKGMYVKCSFKDKFNGVGVTDSIIQPKK